VNPSQGKPGDTVDVTGNAKIPTCGN